MPENDNKNKYENLKLKILVYGILSFVIVISCEFVFIYNVFSAFSGATGGGFINGPASMALRYIQLSVLAIILSVFLVALFKGKIALSRLLILCIVLPILCYNFNYYSFKDDGPLRPLVRKGGMLRFIAIHDFDLNGITDSHEKIRQQSGVSFFDSDEHFLSIHYTAEGKGPYNSLAHCGYSKGYINVSMAESEDSATYNYIKFTLTMKNPEDAEKLSLYYDDLKLESKIEDGNKVSVVLDSDFCAELQRKSYKHIYLKIKCVWE